jgi:hypothetical protein
MSERWEETMRESTRQNEQAMSQPAILIMLGATLSMLVFCLAWLVGFID